MWESCSEKMLRKKAIQGNITTVVEELKKKLLGKLSQYNFKKEMCRDELGHCSPICSRIVHAIKALYLSKDTRFKSWKQKMNELRLRIMYEILTEIPK